MSASPSTVTMVTTRTARKTAAARIGGIARVNGVPPRKQADEDQDRHQRHRDLQRAVEDDADRELGLAAPGELDADDVLDRVAGDRDDDEAGEGLADAEHLDRRLERGDEPFRDEGRRDPGGDEDADRARRSGQTSSRTCASAGRVRGAPVSIARVRTAKTRSSTSAQTTESACSCSLAGRCSAWASVGSISAATASMSSARDHPRRPGRRSAARRAASRRRGRRGRGRGARCERIEPTSEAWTTVTSPAWSAKMADEELGQVADRRLDDAGRGRAQVVAELVGRLADQVGDAGERQAETAKVDERGGAGEVQHAGERRPAAAGGGRHRQVAALRSVPASALSLAAESSPRAAANATAHCPAGQRAAARPAWRPVARQAVSR